MASLFPRLPRLRLGRAGPSCRSASRRRSLAGPLAALGLLAAAPAPAAAQEVGAPAPAVRPWKGHAIYAAAGAGMIADIGEPTINARVMGVLGLSSWAMLEGGFTGMRFSGVDHHGQRSGSTALGIGLGLRVAPLPDHLPVRPYAALRATHIHMSPDLWGEHEHAGTTDVGDHESVHRFGAAAALGFDAAIAGPLRLGVDAEALALSGPGANVMLQGVVTLGFAL